jgi:hypothetical protein
MDDEAQFLLDAPSYSEEEWEERPRCNWSYPPRRSPEYSLPGYTCYAEPRWRFMTTFSNASKTDTLYCQLHSLLFHEGVQRWAMIDHNTKASTRVIDLITEEVCPCTDGDECDPLLEYKGQRIPERKVRRDQNAQNPWSA